MLYARWLCVGIFLLGAGCVPDEIKAAGGGGSAGSGGAAGATSQGGSGGQAGMMPCPTDCDDKNECTDDVCEGGACKNNNKPSMTEVATQTGGDCQKIVCDGNGGTKSVADDEDTPDPGNAECLVMGCVGGAPAAVAKNDGQECDTASATECHSFKCNNGACEQVNEPDGKLISAGTNSNCLDTVCQGGTMAAKQNYKNCDDANPTNCLLPICHPDGHCTLCPECSNAPTGYPCVKTDMTGGVCNAAGVCN